MKLFTRLFGGIGIGIALAILIFIGNKAMPFLSCTGQMFCGVLTCDTSHCDAACESANKANNCEDAIPANYKNTTLFSLLLCGGIGGVWGAAGAMSDASEKHKQKVFQRETDIKNKRAANATIVKQEAHNYIMQAEREYKNEQNLPQYTINYESKRLKNTTDVAAQKCVDEKEKLKKLLNSLNI